ncbi:MAG: type II toxin-antitoxin system VapC family toxin [Spirochaetales bacterium]|nr:type II toxin-antitoxin system VapC family toxin [Spirochaetales bacterium]
MKIVDVNLLIYAINSSSPHHDATREWLEHSLNAAEPVGLAWVVILAFLRLTTNPRVMPKPIPVDQATEIINSWLNLPTVRFVQPGPDHWRILRELLGDLGTGANLTTDAHLAALAIEHGARLYSTDNDFSRFKSLRWEDPTQG